VAATVPCGDSCLHPDHPHCRTCCCCMLWLYRQALPRPPAMPLCVLAVFVSAVLGVMLRLGGCPSSLAGSGAVRR
jgi:hypothetical protein